MNGFPNIGDCKMQCAILIPARSGSKRIPHKNIRELGGKPLLAWSIEVGSVTKLPTFVSTDSRVYAEIAKQYGAQVIHRPPELCTDQAGDYEVIKHALGEIPATMIVYLRPTTPFREAKRVWAAVKIMGHYDYTGLRSVEKMSETAFKCFGMTKQGFLRPLTKGIDVTDRPNQELEQTYHPNGYCDIVRREIVERGALWGVSKYGFITKPTIEIDTAEDFEYATWWAENKGRRWGSGKA